MTHDTTLVVASGGPDRFPDPYRHRGYRLLVLYVDSEFPPYHDMVLLGTAKPKWDGDEVVWGVWFGDYFDTLSDYQRRGVVGWWLLAPPDKTANQ